MKKTLLTILLAISLFAIGKQVSSQTLYFCEDVDSKGYPVNQSDVFRIPRAGGYFYFLVRLPYEINCYSIKYDIYDVDSYGKETYNTTVYHDDLSLNWVWFWKKVTFYTPGYYHVYVNDCNGIDLTSAYLTVKYK